MVSNSFRILGELDDVTNFEFSWFHVGVGLYIYLQVSVIRFSIDMGSRKVNEIWDYE